MIWDSNDKINEESPESEKNPQDSSEEALYGYKQPEIMDQPPEIMDQPPEKHINARNSKFFKRIVAIGLAVVLVIGSVSGVSLYGTMNRELGRQSALINDLSRQLNVQKESLSQAMSIGSKAGVINNINSSSSRNTSNIASTSLSQGSDVTSIAKEVGPSVVGIRMTMTVNSRRFTANQASSEGSGIIISADGYILTNYHVVSYADPKSGNNTATTLEVFLPDGRSAKAKFVGGDSENDLAVVKIPLTGLPVAELGKSSDLQVGELAVAIGNPLGMEFAGSVTVGVVSALNRKMDGQETSLKLIQTDAAINPGNSGGALVNSKGQVIGINTVKISQTGVEGLGFAIAIDDAKPIMQSLILYGYVKNRPYLGITGQDITDLMASMYNVPVGIYLTEVDPIGGAGKAGIRAADIITGINGKAITTMSELNASMKVYKAGDTATINIVRNTTKMAVKVTFTEAK
jgi:serine protease Do